jgi:small-conductance mechanosensitive channel
MASFIGEVDFARFMIFIAVIGTTLFAGNFLSAFIRKYFKLKEKKSWFHVLLPKLVLYAIYAIGFYYGTYKVIGFDITAFAAAFGIIGLLIAFSSQQTLQNIVSGIILFFDRPIQEGEYIEFNNILCKVEDVSLRKTTLRSIDGRLITAPNAQFVTGTVVNYSKSNFYRIIVQLSINSGADIEKARSVLYQIAIDHPEIVPRTQPKKKKSVIEIMLQIPQNIQKFEPKIWIKEMNADKVVLEMWCWIANIRTRERIITEIYLEAKKKFAEAEIGLGK